MNWLVSMIMHDDKDIPFMNYRVLSCPECGKILKLMACYPAPIQRKKRLMMCDRCQWHGNPPVSVTGGFKGTMLMWDELPV